MSKQDEMREALEAIDTHFDEGNPTIDPRNGNLVSDTQYERIRKEFQNAFPDDPYFLNFTGSKYKPNKIIKLSPPMTSIEKASGDTREKDFRDWIRDCCLTLNYARSIALFAESFKIDGGGVRILYKDGDYIGAALRPKNGVDGEDISANMIHVEGVPKKLPLPLTCGFTGEITCYLDVFAEVNAEIEKNGGEVYANPRNYAVPSVRLKNPIETKERRLTFLIHGVTGLANWQQYYQTARGRRLWIEGLNCGLKSVEVQEWKDESDFAFMESLIPKLNLLVDGVIVEVNDLEDQEQMGHHGNKATGKPRGKIAWKFDDEIAEGDVKEIVRQVGRTGKITPVLILEGFVPLAGTMVNRATCHNYAFLHKQGIVPGTRIKIKKSNMIIPKVVEVVSGKGKSNIPLLCPCCGSKTSIFSVGEDKGQEYCSNDICPDRVVSNLTYYLSVAGVKGIGKATVKLLTKYVKEPADFYQLNLTDLEDVGLTERESLLALADIHLVPNPSDEKDNNRLAKLISNAMDNKKKLPIWQFFASLGIEGASESTGRKLTSSFENLEAIRNASVGELMRVDDVGETTALSIHSFFQENRSAVDRLLKYFDLEGKTGGKLKGLTFVFSGSVNSEHSKEYWQSIVEGLGGDIAGNVSKKMVGKGYLVAGDGSGLETAKAKEYGVPVINLEQLKEML